MKKLLSKLILILGILATVIIGFRFLFSSNQLVWGDAPFFFEDGLKEIFFEPYTWLERGNTLGGINSFLWLSPWMVVYGALGTIFNLSNALIIRIIFYFPSLVLSILGPYFLGKYLKFSKVALFISSLFYVLNTYYLLIVDGGQVGIALAYGLFPLLILFLKKFLDKKNTLNFFLALLLSFITTSVDPRFYVIGFATVIVWQIFEVIIQRNFSTLKNLPYLILSLLVLIPLNFYWINPYLKLGVPKISTEVTSLQLNSLLNSLFLYQPHWYQNIYGNINYPPFYFVVIPLFVFINLFWEKSEKMLPFVGTFLFFSFLVKGSTPPFEGLFNWFIRVVPFAEIFRDSSKFFTPLILFGSILIGNSVARLNRKYSKSTIFCLSFIFILFLVNPLFLGRLNWNLSNKDNFEFDTINKTIENDNNSFFRTAWFYEKPSIIYETREKPSLDAKDIVSFRPFSSLNAGSYDSLNFMHQGNWQDWFKLLGIKYLVFSGSQRDINIDQEKINDWDEFLDFVDTQKGITKIKNTEVPAYFLDDTLPEIFGVEKLFVVVGSDDVYEKIEKVNKNFSRANQGFLFVEDGISSLSSFDNVSSTSAVLVFNNRDKDDFNLSFLKENFLDSQDFKYSEWSNWPSSKYLEWKFQLLTRGVDSKEFDYGKGISFSTQPGEEISYEVKIAKAGKYVPIFRILSAEDSSGVEISYKDVEKTYKSSNTNQFSWNIEEPIYLEKGKTVITIKNIEGLNVVNTLALVPKDVFDNEVSFADKILEKYQLIDLKNPDGIYTLSNIISNQSWKEVSFLNDKVLTYDFSETPEEINWIILSQKYNPNWQFVSGDLVLDPLPFYSVLNGFYVDKTWQNYSINFKGQEYFRWGVYVTTISVLLSIIVFIILEDERKNN